MVSAIIFDLDDTLYDEIEYCRSGFRAVAAYIAERFPGASAAALYEAMQRQFDSGERRKVFNSALAAGGIGFDEECVATLVQVYRDHHPAIALPEESRAVLEGLGKRYKLALLTDGFLPAQKLKAQALGIERYFRTIVYTEELGRENWKPSPLGFQKIMFELGAEGSECVYVGDNEEKDFIAPNALGMVTVKLSKPTSLHPAAATEPEAQPAHTIYTLEDLPRLVRTL
jgi:putative hydrolase of the HAD superfamily